jgi:hypothetical protein
VYAYHWSVKRPLTNGLLKLIADGAIGIKIPNIANLLDDLLKAEEGNFSTEKKDKQLELF